MGAEAPILWLTFLAWHAVRRTGGVDGYTVPESFDDFSETCVEVIAIDAEGEPITRASAAVTADPTRPGLGTG